MNLAEKARAIKNGRNHAIKTVLQEIANYFKEYLNGNEFEQLMENKISDPINQQNSYGIIILKINNEYVEGHEGKERRAIPIITLEDKKWICPDNFFETHGINFHEIETDVGWHLHAITRHKLQEMGFTTAEQYDPTAKGPGVHTSYWVKFLW